MRLLIPFLCLIVISIRAEGAEILFDFNQHRLNETPHGFRSILSGVGRPGEWKVIMDEVPSLVAPLLSNVPAVVKRPVLAQLSSDPTDERFPILIYEGETFGDFRLTTRFKIVAGTAEQMAGIAFRIQDEKNYYYLRTSALGNNLRFFKVVNGQRSPPIGPETEVPKGTWHEMAIECQGNQIRCLLNGQELIPPLTDNSFSAGKIGFWTKSDSISYFVDTKIVYTPRETLSKVLIREALGKYPRLLGLKIYAAPKGRTETLIIGSTDAKEIGLPAGKVEKDVISRDVTYFGRGKQWVSVTLPLHDRNGDPIAAVTVTMKSFVGQTEQNAIVRAMPVIKEMEARIRSSTGSLE